MSLPSLDTWSVKNKPYQTEGGAILSKGDLEAVIKTEGVKKGGVTT